MPRPDAEAATMWAYLEPGLLRIMSTGSEVPYPEYMSMYTVAYNVCTLTDKEGNNMLGQSTLSPTSYRRHHCTLIDVFSFMRERGVLVYLWPPRTLSGRTCGSCSGCERFVVLKRYVARADFLVSETHMHTGCG